MKRNLIIILVILAIIGAGVNLVFAQPGSGMMGIGPGMMRHGMMESVDSEYEFLIKMIPHH